MKNHILSLFFLIGTLQVTAMAHTWNAEEYHKNSTSQENAAFSLMKYIKLSGNECILDVGCGDGKITSSLAKDVKEGKVLGVDLSPEMIDFAKKTFPLSENNNLDFAVKDACKLDYEGKFDLIVSFTALQWTEDHAAVLQGFYKALKTKGTIVITMPMGPPLALSQAADETMSSPLFSQYFKNFSTGINFPEEKSYLKLVEENKFQTLRYEVISHTDTFDSKEAFTKFFSQWFPNLISLPENLREPFLEKIVTRYLELEKQDGKKSVQFTIDRLEVIAEKKQNV